MNICEEQFIYQSTCLMSAVVCIVFGTMLFFVRRSLFNRQSLSYPVWYIMVRKILGIAYCIIGALSNGCRAKKK